MNSFSKLLQWLSLFLLFSSSIYALPRPRTHKFHNIETAKMPQISEYKTMYYHQILDHFNYQPESYKTFKQKYIINFEYWGGAKSKSPILVYLGDESPLDVAIVDALILTNYGQHFKALLLYLEHRFYGESIPFGISKEKIMKNARIRGYFSSAQAIADYAELILHVKEKLNAHYSPVIVIGGSYGGLLASWLRLKYPHVALGALASSAPILFFDNIIPPNHGFYSIVTKDFKETSQSCFETIRDSWKMIDKVGKKPNGLSILSHKFNTCGHLNNTGELKDFLQHVYSFVAEYNIPPITSICNAIDHGINQGEEDILARIYAGVVAFPGNQTTCQEINWKSIYPKDTILGWEWQDLKLVLKNFGSNIIFSNGLRDPYSIGGVLENLSDSIIALYTTNGTHTMDMVEPAEDDPEWLVNQRKREVEIIDGWLRKYYANLKHDYYY